MWLEATSFGDADLAIECGDAVGELIDGVDRAFDFGVDRLLQLVHRGGDGVDFFGEVVRGGDGLLAEDVVAGSGRDGERAIEEGLQALLHAAFTGDVERFETLESLELGLVAGPGGDVGSERLFDE